MNRGHDFLPAEDALADVPDLYATEDVPLADKTIHLHYFVGGCDWYVAEVDRDRRIAFGYVNLGDPRNAEWGYIDLTELRDLRATTPQGYTLLVERDLHWTATRFGDLS